MFYIITHFIYYIFQKHFKLYIIEIPDAISVTYITRQLYIYYARNWSVKTAKIWEWISSFILHVYWACDYLSVMELKLI